jgi:hypothetical protein
MVLVQKLKKKNIFRKGKKVQITILEYNQSLDNPLKYFLFISPLTVSFGSIYTLTQFIFFISPCTSGLLSSKFCKVIEVNKRNVKKYIMNFFVTILIGRIFKNKVYH